MSSRIVNNWFHFKIFFCVAVSFNLLPFVLKRFLVVMEGMNISRNHRDFAIRKFHVITETFLSLVGTDTPQDVELLVQVNSRNFCKFAVNW